MVTTKAVAPADISGFTPDFERWRPEVETELSQAFLDAWVAQGGAITSRARDLATQYALERAGDLIGGKYDVGQATTDRLKALVAQAIDNGYSPQQLRDGLRDDLAFSPVRARMIARTETATALGQGQDAAAREMEQDQKSWQAGDSCDICLGNESDDWIDIDDTFSSGDDTIPAHPNCTCDVIYRTSSVHEATAPAIVKEARCQHCNRKLGENVNAGARLHCPRCKDLTTVNA